MSRRPVESARLGIVVAFFASLRLGESRCSSAEKIVAAGGMLELGIDLEPLPPSEATRVLVGRSYPPQLLLLP
jgi:hypothetical protein